MFASLPPLTLYVHLPWCIRKCPYCDFNSHEFNTGIPEDEYVDALLIDLEQELPSVWGRTCHAVFIGGGTPSLFTPAAIDRLLSGIRARLPLAPGAEVTLEANPGSSEAEKFAGFRDAGVNRLSIGVQTFNPAQLKKLGRIHGPDEALRAAQAASDAGFNNFNLDLMFGLPGQSVASALEDARTALGCHPTHLSVYQLTIEPNTRFYRRPPMLPDDDTAWHMQTQIRDLLAAHHYSQYEVSAYAREPYRCQHNLNYWQFGDYLGIGAGAHGKITASDHIRRTAKLRAPRRYLRDAAGEGRLESSRILGDDEVVFEFMLNALRLKEPLPVSLFQQRTGRPLAVVSPVLERAQAEGLVRLEQGCLSTTDRGFRFLNDLLEQFLPEQSTATA